MSNPENGHDETPKDEPKLAHHTYDGIREYDNPMPRWWVQLFWVTVVFSLGYAFHFGVGNGQSILSVHEEEMAGVRAEEAKKALSQAVSEASLKTVLADQNMVSAGATLFAGRCAACHSDKGQGNIGPNLTDMQWIHGQGRLMDIYQTVTEGVSSKGMPAWQRQLSPTELRQVVAFVGSIRGQNVPGKAAEGQAVDAAIYAQ
jgi:cytochrome c oxidase cbb3-type subunit 3